MSQQWLSIEELAEELNVPVRSIRTWRYKGTAPKGRRFGRHLRFHRADIDQWVKEQPEGFITESA